MSLDLQSNFRKFHDAIKFDREQNRNWLTNKRDMLVQELQTYLRDNRLPSVKAYNQGSYAMGTGVKPIGDRDFDIDVALVFDLDVRDYQPKQVKKWVQEAMSRYSNRDVIMKRPCVRVQYHRNGSEHYHVDLAVYGKKDINKDKEDLQLAKGFLNSREQYKIWEDSEPFELKNLINNKFDNEDYKAQFKRIICYLKRWKDENFKASGDEAPTGIALTAMAYKWYRPHSKGGKLDDLCTLRCFFEYCCRNDHGLYVTLPVKPYNNLLEKIINSSRLTNSYKTKVEKLYYELEKANAADDESQAIQILQAQFGPDFPA